MLLCRLCYIEECDRIKSSRYREEIDHGSKADLERVSGVRLSVKDGKLVFDQDFFDIIEIFEQKRQEQLEKEIEAMCVQRASVDLGRTTELQKHQENIKSEWMMIERSTASNSEEDYTIQIPNADKPKVNPAMANASRDVLSNY